MSSDHDTITSRDYEREARHTRNRLADSLNELNNRLTPGQVFDEVLTYARGGSGTFMRALGGAAKDNPVPAMLISAGCMLFLSDKVGLSSAIARQAKRSGEAAGDSMRSGMRDGMDSATSTASAAAQSAKSGLRSAASAMGEQATRAGDSVRRGASAVGETVADTASAAAGRVTETASEFGDRLAQTASMMGSRMSDAASGLKEGMAGVGEAAQDYGAAMGEQAADAAARARQQTSKATKQLIDAATSLIKEQPLLAASIAIAVGAAIAAALPKTETEDEFLGQASDAVKEAVGTVASEQFQTAKAAAGNFAQRAMDVAQNEGLTPGRAAEAAREMGDKIKRVVTETAMAEGQSVPDGSKG
jgi:hypothetical protein